MQGTLSIQEDEGVKLLARRLALLKKDIPVTAHKRLVLRVQSIHDRTWQAVMEIFSHQKGTLPVVIFDAGSGKYISPKGLAVNPTEELLGKLTNLLGKENVVLQ